MENTLVQTLAKFLDSIRPENRIFNGSLVFKLGLFKWSKHLSLISVTLI